MVVSLAACGSKNDGFSDEYQPMIDRISALNEDTSKVTKMVYTTWDNVGVSNLNMFYGAVLAIGQEATLDDVKFTFLSSAACVVDPKQYWDDNEEADRNILNALKVLSADTDKAQAVLDQVTAYNQFLASLTDTEEALTASVKEFREKFAEKHPDECDNLREWMLETSMYVDFAENPSGSLIEYGSNISKYEENLSRFKKMQKVTKEH